MGCYPATRQLELFCSATCADDKSGQLPKIHDHYCPELVHCWLFPLEFNLKNLALNLGIFPRVENQKMFVQLLPKGFHFQDLLQLFSDLDLRHFQN